MTRAVRPLRIAILGLSITSSWGNGHATTYRSLIKGLTHRGHDVTFFERRQPWYEANRDLRNTNLCEIVLYDSVEDLDHTWRRALADADLVMLGSYVPQGAIVAERVFRHARGVTAFYDIDTPVTLAELDSGECTYLTRTLIPEFDLYLSFAGGPVLDILENAFGARKASALYCSVDAEHYFPMRTPQRYDLGYLGTYSRDRQPKLEMLLNEPARRWSAGRFCVAGPQYPATIRWPRNVSRVDHVAPSGHCLFYNSQRFTLNVTRRNMVQLGFSPSVRLFEAAACGVPIISDDWDGLDQLFVRDREIVIARTADDVLRALREMSADDARAMGSRARARVLREHTSEHRALELEQHVLGLFATANRSVAARPPSATLH